MIDAIEKIVAVFIAISLLFLYPLAHMAEKQEDTARIYVLSQTTQLVDHIRDQGYITKEMMENYRHQLLGTGTNYEIHLEHRHKVYYPIYEDLWDASTFTGRYEAHHEGYFTDEIMATLEQEGIYYFSQGDYILIETKNSSKTLSTKMKSLLYGDGLHIATIYVKYGGQIRYVHD